jgi:hypothetical protein
MEKRQIQSVRTSNIAYPSFHPKVQAAKRAEMAVDSLITFDMIKTS